MPAAKKGGGGRFRASPQGLPVTININNRRCHAGRTHTTTSDADKKCTQGKKSTTSRVCIPCWYSFRRSSTVILVSSYCTILLYLYLITDGTTHGPRKYLADSCDEHTAKRSKSTRQKKRPWRRRQQQQQYICIFASNGKPAELYRRAACSHYYYYYSGDVASPTTQARKYVNTCNI